VHEASVESSLHEGSHIRLRGLIKFVIGFVVAGVVIHAIVWWMFILFRDTKDNLGEAVTGVTPQYIPPPEPRLQPSIAHNALPVQDLVSMREREHAEFSRRGWVDEKTGAVRIPEQIAAQVAQLSQPKPASQPARK
jgi:hypothetical protein